MNEILKPTAQVYVVAARVKSCTSERRRVHKRQSRTTILRSLAQTERPGHRTAPLPEAAFYPTQLSLESDVDLLRNPRDKISHGHANLWSPLRSEHSFLCPLIKCEFTLKGKMCTLSFRRRFNFQSLQLSLILLTNKEETLSIFYV